MIAREGDGNPVCAAKSENAVYVLYTSGSTGKPKGVVITHRALSNQMAWMQAAFAWTQNDRFLQKTPISFDASVWEFHAPLLAGATLIMAQPEGHRDGEYLVRAIREHNVTVLQTVPSLLRLLLDQKDFGKCRSLKQVHCGGESLPADLVMRFFDCLDAQLHNLYGPTEACINAAWWTCRHGERRTNIPIGHPISNMKIYLLDRFLQPVPVGVPGELHIAGAGLSRGYLNRPELTAERFIPDIFSLEPGARLYRTGDLARYLPGGEIEFLGRIDTQVKLRGFRIELQEIETVLAEHACVKETVVTSVEFSPGDTCLVAYVVPRDSAEPSNTNLRAFLKDRLPDYMVPAVFVSLDALPRLPNGKVDRRALPHPGQAAQPGPKDGFEAPRNAGEEAIAKIWCQVLGLRQVGVHDNFFDLGGHSLLATMVISRVNDVLGMQIPLRTIFDAPTIAEMAASVAQSQPRELGPEELALLERIESMSPEEVTDFISRQSRNKL
jgi:amino acid adenylation domain-containing protein